HGAGRAFLCQDVIFFFQAEDGIRDKLVTGVQTCALPILGAQHAAPLQFAWAGRPAEAHLPTAARATTGAPARRAAPPSRLRRNRAGTACPSRHAAGTAPTAL